MSVCLKTIEVVVISICASFRKAINIFSLDQGVPRCLSLLKLGGEIIIADCFRSKNYRPEVMKSTVGGGHPIANFRAVLESWPVAVISGTDITEQSAPSVEIEQGMFNILGFALPRVDAELKLKHPRVRWVLNRMVRLCLNERKRSRLDQRLDHQTRNWIASYFPKTGLKPPTSVGKNIYRAPQVLQNTEPFDFSRRRFS